MEHQLNQNLVPFITICSHFMYNVHCIYNSMLKNSETLTFSQSMTFFIKYSALALEFSCKAAIQYSYKLFTEVKKYKIPSPLSSFPNPSSPFPHPPFLFPRNPSLFPPPFSSPFPHPPSPFRDLSSLFPNLLSPFSSYLSLPSLIPHIPSPYPHSP